MTDTTLIKALVGSHAHGLATPESDWDFRSVYVTPTTEILSLNSKYKGTHWNEGEVDNTSYELGHFLHLATKSNPSILEIFASPDIQLTEGYEDLGIELLNLFPHVWSSKAVFDSHRGYGHNQRKKLFDDPYGPRARKYACAWLRSVYNGYHLLTYGDFSLTVNNTEIEHILREWRNPSLRLTVAEVVNVCMAWELKLEKAYGLNPDRTPDLEKVNSFLLDIRAQFWNV